ncbi:hypothetical protein HOD38_00990 [archaeon]|nr:hypothetical protein [archaeon]MBT4396819.1 hypothetical protein [archaeon]MBT4441503.1 hypothetical protein [archaeon]
MKRILFLGLFVVLFMTLVSAGYSTDIDFSEEDTVGVVMGIGDEVRFELYEDTHAIYLEAITVSDNWVKFRIAPFLSNSTDTAPGFVTLDTVAKLDLDKDGVTDLNVALYSIESEQVTLLFQVAEQEQEITGNVGVVDEVDGDKSKYLIIIGVVIGILILVLIFVNLGSSEKEEEIKEEPKEVVESP